MSAAEHAFWLDYRDRHGFPVDRLEAVAANAGAYVGGTWGGKTGAGELVFKPRLTYSHAEVRAGFDALRKPPANV